MKLLEIDLWPHQERAIVEIPRRISIGERRICLTSPTGGGKSVILCLLIKWAVENDFHVVLYTNRRMLIRQLSRVLESYGIEFGVRASGHEDRRERQVQISSLPTENARVLKAEKWKIHGHGHKTLVLVDEAHLNKSGTAEKILAMHYEQGGIIVGVTATPIDLGHLYESLVVAGTPSELRKCGALVPALHVGPDEPDMKHFKANVKTGEFSVNDVRKAIKTKCIFASVMENYERLNSDKKPTLLFGPGLNESIWFAEQFRAAGIRAAHIDGDGIWLDGEYNRASPGERDDLVRMVKEGEIAVLCNRFVLREGLDIPEIEHVIAATVMGSLQSWLQSMGRALRACPLSGKTKATIQDHGGHWWRHGSVNMDRVWNLNYTESMISGMRAESLRNKKEPEPIRCPKCSSIRLSGPVCPQCGFESSKRSRMVMQMDGTLREHVGDIHKPRVERLKPDTETLWKSCYYRARNSKTRMTFNQARGLFFHEHHYYPPSDLPLMPKSEADWYRAVADVPRDRLL
jgi:superfamily II DNA or RNA helicase